MRSFALAASLALAATLVFPVATADYGQVDDLHHEEPGSYHPVHSTYNAPVHHDIAPVHHDVVPVHHGDDRGYHAPTYGGGDVHHMSTTTHVDVINRPHGRPGFDGGVMGVHEDTIVRDGGGGGHHGGPVIMGGGHHGGNFGDRGGVDAVHEDTIMPGGDTIHETTTVHETTALIPMAFNSRVIDPAHLSTNSFYAHEIFALFNPHKKTCLYLKDTKKPKLVTKKCALEQPFDAHSPFAFYWIPTGDNNLAFLAARLHDHVLCARRKFTGTFFLPCDGKSIKYSLGATHKKKGTFMIRDASKGSQCMDTYMKHGLHMSGCRMASRDQQFVKAHIGFM